MSYTTTYNLVSLMTDFKACATAAGFCTVKIGSPEEINFDHNICYDLLNIDYPSSYIAEGVKEVYTFNLVIARPITAGSTQGVQTFDDISVNIFAELELKMWNLLSCLALGISGGGGCKAHIPKHKIQIYREKGTFNDKLIALRVKFDAIANIAVTVDPCGGGSSSNSGCDEPCQDFFGACGCTDPMAVNYDPNAGVDDGTCCYSEAEDPCNPSGANPSFPPSFPGGETSNPG
tara:strand:- start:584 stop:1282 length:699 start_codon:yes stop_codon:yes gene_type:complete